MKPANFDFRIWDKTKEAFLKQEPTLIKLDNERVIAGRISKFYANTADIADMFIGGNDLEIELWSGMRDKNGRKIYEGDIVKNRDLDNLLCLYDSHNLRFVFKYINRKEYDICYTPMDTLEILGNIHENKDLLE